MALLARWSFDTVDGPCSDSSGAGQHLTYFGPSTSVAGKVGPGRRLVDTDNLFSGTPAAQYIAGASNAATRTAAAGSWTFACWVKRSEPDASLRVGVVAALGGDQDTGLTADNSLLLINYFTGVGLFISWANIDDTIQAAIIPDDSTWHHLAIVKNSVATTVTAYLDGAQTDTDSYTGEPTDGANATWTLGGVPSAGSYTGHTNLALDDVRFYGSAFSAAEVLALYTWGVNLGSVSLTTLRARVREACDMTGSTFVTDAATSLDAFINAALDELYDLVLQHFGEDYYVSSTTLTTVAGTSAYSLPNDFYKLLGVDLTYNGDSCALEQFQFTERNAYKQSALSGVLPRYRLEGGNLRLYPAPTSVMSGTLWYVPTRTLLVSGSDTVNFPGGWEQYAVVGAALACSNKEESDGSVLAQMKAEQRSRIEAAASRRDAGAPSRVTDVDAGYVGENSAYPWRW